MKNGEILMQIREDLGNLKAGNEANQSVLRSINQHLETLNGRVNNVEEKSTQNETSLINMKWFILAMGGVFTVLNVAISWFKF